MPPCRVRSATVGDLSAFERIPVTLLAAYRRRRLADVLASPPGGHVDSWAP